MKEKLITLKERIRNGNWKHVNRPLFNGADLIIEEDLHSRWPGKVAVLTDYEKAKELSALIYELKNIFADELDYLNKYYFYPELGNAANTYLAGNRDIKGLLLSVVDRAIMLDKEWSGHLYFAYGSNMDKKQMAERCPSATLMGKGFLAGYSFGVDAKGYATVGKKTGGTVEGAVWHLTKEDEESVYVREGVRSGCYSKEYINVEYNGYEIPMLVYISNRERANISSKKEYMRKVINAARDIPLSDDYISKIESFSC
jgi:cation transport regulator ChaC